jgi:hemoglobin-like flavoprotein
MNPDHIAIVRSSWPAIATRDEALTVRFYEVMFEIDESAARLFASVDMASQRAKLFASLTVIVDALDDLDQLLPAVAELGRRHATYGVQRRHFDVVGQSLGLAIERVLGDDFTPAVREAWAEAYALVSAVMMRALDRALAGDGRSGLPASGK